VALRVESRVVLGSNPARGMSAFSCVVLFRVDRDISTADTQPRWSCGNVQKDSQFQKLILEGNRPEGLNR